MHFEQAHQFICSRHTLPVKHSSFSLSDELLDQRCDAADRRGQPLRTRFRPSGERVLCLLSLVQAGLRQLQ